MSSPSRGAFLSLSALTLATGLVDAASVLGLGVFAANMTGNVVFLGFSIGGAPGYSVAAALMALAGFLLGAFLAGLFIKGTCTFQTAGRALGIEAAVLAAAALVVWLTGAGAGDGWADWLLLAVLGVAMGLQNAIALKTGVTDMRTTVLTLTLTSLASDLARGKVDKAGMRILSVILLLAGGLIGALLFYGIGLIATILAASLAVGIAAILMARARVAESAAMPPSASAR
jgi:uncharacterized membrane protein YoaK (UPF0700 family)